MGNPYLILIHYCILLMYVLDQVDLVNMFYGGNVGEPKDLDLPLKAKMISNWKISMLEHVCNKI